MFETPSTKVRRPWQEWEHEKDPQRKAVIRAEIEKAQIKPGKK